MCRIRPKQLHTRRRHRCTGRAVRAPHVRPARRAKTKRIAAVILLLLLLLAGLLIWAIKVRVEPNVEAIGRMRTNIMVSQIVNKSINDELYETGTLNDLLIRETNGAGQLDLLRADTQAMNLLITEISKEMQEEFAARPEDVYTVPLGALLGDWLLSQTGPSVDLRIIPLNVTGMDFKTEFESTGINQTRYRVYIDMTCDVKALAPFIAENFTVTTQIPVAEAIILGGVPDSYVNVPEEDILDVTQE